MLLLMARRPHVYLWNRQYPVAPPRPTRGSTVEELLASVKLGAEAHLNPLLAEPQRAHSARLHSMHGVASTNT